jgi:hypothetical protein
LTIEKPVTCPECGFEGVLEGSGTKPVPPSHLFADLGKDEKGHQILKCPCCARENTFSAMGPVMKIGRWVLTAGVLATGCALLRWLLFGR